MNVTHEGPQRFPGYAVVAQDLPREPIADVKVAIRAKDELVGMCQQATAMWNEVAQKGAGCPIIALDAASRPTTDVEVPVRSDLDVFRGCQATTSSGNELVDERPSRA